MPVLDTDAALRQRIMELEQERDEAVRVAKALTAPAPITDADIQWATDSLSQLDILKRQLAEKDAEIAALKHEISQLLFFAPQEGK